MPMPWTYRHATKEWRAFLVDAKERMSLTSDNLAYTAVDAVFQVFRRRVTAEEGVMFASVLPTVLRAIFVKEWDIAAVPVPFDDRQTLTREAQQIRPNHNLTPDNAIEATAWALWRTVDGRDFARVLSKLPKEAQEFWHVDVDDPHELKQRII